MVLNTTDQSSDDTMLNDSVWTKEEDQKLYEACVHYGNEWTLVSPYVGREKEECIKRWKSIIPDDWKSFSHFSWCDEDILRLIETVHQARKIRGCPKENDLQSKPINWYLVAAMMNKDEWLYDSSECYEVWSEVQSMPSSRMGDFTAFEDSILLRRVKEWGESRHGEWRQLSRELKRDYRQLNGRWRILTKSRYKSKDKTCTLEKVIAGDNSDHRKRPLSKKVQESVEVFY